MPNDIMRTDQPTDGSNNELQPSMQGVPRFTRRDDRQRSLIIAGVALFVALVSFFVIGRFVTNPEFYSSTIASLDEKKNTVMRLMGASTGSAAAISLLPGDAGTPIAEKLVDLSSDFLIVIAAIYLEKYLLTILGFASFKVLVPIACIIIAGALALREGTPAKQVMVQVATKLLLFAISAFLVVPVSVRVSAMIENTYETSITQTIETAEQTTDAIEDSAAEGKSTDSANPLQFLLNMPEELNGLTQSAQNSLNNFIEALAVMIVTSCIIPILVLLFFLWLIRIILGIDLDLPVGMRGMRRSHGRMRH